MNSLIKQIYADICYYTGSSKKLRSIIGTVFFDASLQLLLLYRLAHYFFKKQWNVPAKICEWFQILLSGCYISRRAEIGNNFRIAHPVGIVIGSSKIGNNVKIWQNVTIGADGKIEGVREYPVIEDNVKVYANAILLGAITIGENTSIGALSLIRRDIPPNSTALTDKTIARKSDAVS